ncbi:MAG: flagellar protein FliT [Gammaproteobacteria bacterium]|nr:flagellar protein FliT [Gammaproteobacteria bacterium]
MTSDRLLPEYDSNFLQLRADTISVGWIKRSGSTSAARLLQKQTGFNLTESKSALLSRIVQLTQEMLQQAESSSWEQVGELEQSRQQLIQNCFPLDDSIENPDLAGNQISMIVDLDKKIMRMASKERKSVASILGELGLGRQAVKTYRQVEGN